MKSKLIVHLIIGITIILSSCTKTIDINNYIDVNEDLRFFNTSDSIFLDNDSNYVINPKDDRFIKLMKWGKENTNDWENSVSSYMKEYGVIQEDFSLSVNNDIVIINIKEEDSKQYVKKIEKGELLFLLSN